MSHFAVAVITKNKDEVEVYKILEPYWEELKVPRYVKYTKEQLINEGKKEIQAYKSGIYAEYISNPSKYKEECTNEDHIKYLEEEFPKKLNWTDEEIYKNEIRWYDEDQIGENGEVYSTYNPNSKWDWYEIGGRFENELLTRIDNNDTFGQEYNKPIIVRIPPQGYKWVNGAKIKDIDFNKMEEINGETFCAWALVDEKGWYEKGSMGWWAMSDATEESINDFAKKSKEYIEMPENQDKYMIIVDCHI